MRFGAAGRVTVGGRSGGRKHAIAIATPDAAAAGRARTDADAKVAPG